MVVSMKTTLEQNYNEWLVHSGDFARNMTIADHFAGLAMQAQLNNPGINKLIADGNISIADVCESSYEWADAMIKERAK
jgi:hypothetical protein